MNNSNFKLDKWTKELKSLMGDVVYLKNNNAEFLELAKKWNSKKVDLQLWIFAKRNYVSYMSMAIRRLSDNHKDAVSLLKVINDIYTNTEAVKRKWFLKEWPDGVNEKPFKEFFGNSETLSADIILGHADQLIAKTKAITDRADQYEAHKDKNPKLTVEPTFDNIDDAVSTICELYKKYYYLLTQSSLSI